MTKIFVYGTLRRGYWNHHIMGKSEFIGEADTGPGYTKVINGLPYLVEDPEGIGCKGEIYYVNEDVLKTLDFLEGHPIWYKRTPMTVYMSKKPVEVECYLMPIENM